MITNSYNIVPKYTDRQVKSQVEKNYQMWKKILNVQKFFLYLQKIFLALKVKNKIFLYL